MGEEVRTDLLAVDGGGDRGGDCPRGPACVVTAAFEAAGEDRLARRDLSCERVGELQLPPRAGSSFSICSKMEGPSTYRPTTPRSEGASLARGFSTMPRSRAGLPGLVGSTIPYWGICARDTCCTAITAAAPQPSYTRASCAVQDAGPRMMSSGNSSANGSPSR